MTRRFFVDGKILKSFCFDCMKVTKQKLRMDKPYIILECQNCGEELYAEIE